jgi:hypothetical protein
MSPSKGSAAIRDAALAYAAQGWPVLPLRPQSKEPVTKHGLLDATTDERIIEAWWYAHPEANLGLRTGIAFDVLDIDSLEGYDNLRGLSGHYVHHGPLSVTGKGWHALFQVTGARNKTNLVPKVDFRGTNGYIVAPPSLHPRGTTYHWDRERDPSHPLPEAPAWLLDLVREPERESPRVFVSKDGIVTPLTGTFAHDLDLLTVAMERGLNPKKRGGRWVAKCPFHTEDTPSFTLYTEATRQSFYCFGCHAWGDALDLQRNQPAGHR